MLAKAHKRFLAALEAISGVEGDDFPPPDDPSEPFLRVLIVDDHRATTDTLFSLTAKWGHDVQRAYDGVTGLALATAFQPDVLLLDMLMPNMNGFEVTRRVRNMNPSKRCFIVAITGRTDGGHRTKCYEAGVDLLLIKPVPPSHLQTLLRLEFERTRLNRGATADIPRHDFAAN
jgi:two-component system alkaline phosphatase synthesis response regulator PhoP